MSKALRRARVSLATATSSKHLRARAALARDHVTLSRHLFLAGAVRIGAPDHLGAPITVTDLAARLGVAPGPRLDAWLALGTAVGELRAEHGRVVAHGYRLRALTDGDPAVRAEYSTLLGFGVGIPQSLPTLLAGTTDRNDLADAEVDIAAIAELADPLARPMLAEALEATHARSLLDVGCGDGRLIAWALDRRPGLHATGIDLAVGATAAARERFGDRAAAVPVRLVTGRLGDIAADLGRFNVVSSANAVYYEPPARLAGLIIALADRLAPAGELVVATAIAPDVVRRGPTDPITVASALLDLQLRCQPGGLRLPTSAELDAAMAAAGLQVQARHQLAGVLPYVAVRARHS